MPFYYLREKGSANPKSENDFDYLVYNEEPTNNPIIIPHDSRQFLAHELLDKPKWHWNDEVINVTNSFDVVMNRFEKCYTETGFTVWKQVPLI